jgi:hypothetical protein
LAEPLQNGPPPEDVLARWGRNGTGIGVLGGYRGLVAVDIDTEDPALRDAITSVLPALSPIRKRGAKGETLFFHGPGIGSQSWDIGKRRVVDLIAAGRQTVLPPTVHPDTRRPYAWTGLETLQDITPEELPLLPADIAERITEALKPFGYWSEPPLGATSSDGETPHRQLNDAAMGRLRDWVPALKLCRCRYVAGRYEAVPTWRPSTTGQPTEKRKRNLKIHPKGIRDFGADQPYTPLDLVMVVDGCDLDTAFIWLADRLGWRTGFDVSGLVPAEPKAEPVPRPANELEQYTTVPGVVGEIVNWITATAQQPNRILALGAAVTVIGTLIGRRVAGPTRSATHLYVVPIAPSGAGKQHPMDMVRRLMRAAKAESHVTGPTRFFSLSAVERHLTVKPLSLCLIDEIGGFLKRVTSGRASNHELGISEILRTLWGVSFSTIETSQRAQEDSVIIQCPALSILGMSTPDEFLAALQGESVANGFLNRYLLLDAGDVAADVEPQIEHDTVPSSMAEALNALYLWSGSESLLSIADPEADYVPDVLPWAMRPVTATRNSRLASARTWPTIQKRLIT